MSNRRISMNKARRIIIYSEEKQLSEREIARSLKVARDTVSEYLDKYKKSGLDSATVKTLNDKELLIKLGYFSENRNIEKYQILIEEFPEVSKEIKKTGVTLQKLWQEYIERNPSGYQYTQFCHHYSEWRKNSGELATMHIEHKAGEKMFVDYAGKKLYITSKETGEKTPVEVFIAVLGASLLTYVTATESQKKIDWISSNEKALRYFGGVPKAIVPDCLKTGINDAHRFDPEINAEYHDFADHYNTVILPARPAAPKDKALVENAVKIVYMWVYAAIRDKNFYSLDELNTVISEKLEDYNNREMKKLKMSRREFFNATEKIVLQSLPNDYYSIRKFLKQTVPFIYHIEIPEDYHYYSVPYRYINRKVKIIYTSTVVEIYYQNERIAFHKRVFSRKGYTTLHEHMPSHHKWYSDWNVEYFLEWAEKTGASTKKYIDKLCSKKRHSEQVIKFCYGMKQLSKKYDEKRLENACAKIIEFDDFSFKSLESMLKNGLDSVEENTDSIIFNIQNHENIRNAEYYSEGGEENERTCCNY